MCSNHTCGVVLNDRPDSCLFIQFIKCPFVKFFINTELISSICSCPSVSSQILLFWDDHGLRPHLYDFFRSITLFTNTIWISWLLIMKLAECIALCCQFYHQQKVCVNKSSNCFSTSENRVRREFEIQYSL